MNHLTVKSNDPGVVLLYGPPWSDAPRMSKHHLAERFSRRQRVLYIEAPIHPLSFVTRTQEAVAHVRRVIAGPQEIRPNLWVYSFLYPLPYHGFISLTSSRYVNLINQKAFQPFLLSVLRALHIHKPVLLVGQAHALPLISALDPAVCIYHCSDELASVSGFPSSYAAMEEDLMASCDAVIATSERLAAEKRSYHNKVLTVPNAADFHHFASAAVDEYTAPSDLNTIRRPIIGYVGSMYEWLNYDLVLEIAVQRPQWSFVFVGPRSKHLPQRLTALHNVHFLGSRPYEDVPRYLQGFEVAWIPFCYHDVTLKASPIKFYEYLAAGRPTVATKLPDLERFSHVAHLAATSVEFIAAITEALEDDTHERRSARMALARKHSWDARFEDIDLLISELSI